jgi:hypothetical protein
VQEPRQKQTLKYDLPLPRFAEPKVLENFLEDFKLSRNNPLGSFFHGNLGLSARLEQYFVEHNLHFNYFVADDVHQRLQTIFFRAEV